VDERVYLPTSNLLAKGRRRGKRTKRYTLAEKKKKDDSHQMGRSREKSERGNMKSISAHVHQLRRDRNNHSHLHPQDKREKGRRKVHTQSWAWEGKANREITMLRRGGALHGEN